MLRGSFDKVMDKLSSNKYILNQPLDEYISCNYQILVHHTPKKYIFSSEHNLLANRRRDIVSTLQGMNYKRGKKGWTEKVVVSFITEVTDSSIYSTIEEISGRYNVSDTKVYSMVSFFFNLCRNRYHLDEYFTDIDYTMWKYRESKYFDKYLKENKVTKRELDILSAFNMIKYDNKKHTYIMY